MSKLTNCKACQKEIAKAVKKCPSCGKDQRNWFGKHKIITGVIVLVVFIKMVSGGENSATTAPVDTKTATVSTDIVKATTPEEPATPKVQTYSDGKYLVNKDLPSELYRVTLNDSALKMGYVERSRSVSMGMDDTIANELVQGSGYVKIVKGDFAVRLQGVKITLQKE